MIGTFKASADVHVLTSTAAIPALGSIAINAFVLDGPEPLLVDTGAVRDSDEFMTALRTVIDPAALRYVWLSHTDFDHVGSLSRLLEANADLEVITTFLGVGIMSLADPMPMDRVHFVNPGETITVGGRTLTAVKPPIFDNACTTGFYDSSGTLFTSDCFGALLDAIPASAADLGEQELRDGQVFWATVDSPWVHQVDPRAFAAGLDRFRGIGPRLVLSSHLPPAPGRIFELMLDNLSRVPAAERFVAPDEAALREMLASR